MGTVVVEEERQKEKDQENLEEPIASEIPENQEEENPEEDHKNLKYINLD